MYGRKQRKEEFSGRKADHKDHKNIQEPVGIQKKRDNVCKGEICTEKHTRI